MIRHIDDSFNRHGKLRAKPYPHPYQSDSLFYDANGSYGIDNTCNHWTADTLRSGGISIADNWLLPLSASDVMNRLEKD
jgi:hypothetical protein